MIEVEFKSVRLLKILANALRQKILRQLQEGPRHPEALARLVCRPLPAVSRALGLLAAADLVAFRTEGHGVLYFVKHPDVLELLFLADAFVRCASLRAVLQPSSTSLRAGHVR
jgi:DNA-binding transcriptional ArsR family regulator